MNDSQGSENRNNQNKSSAADQAKRLWSGLGSFLTSVKQKTLDMVDNIQDQITELDDRITKSHSKSIEMFLDSNKNFDKTLIPIIENPSTYIELPTQADFTSFYESFELSDYTETIKFIQDNSSKLSQIFQGIVPNTISEKEFWSRLFSKIEMKRKAKMISEELKQHLSAHNSPIKMPRKSQLSSDDLIDKNEDGKQNEMNQEEKIELTAEELVELSKLDDISSGNGWSDD